MIKKELYYPIYDRGRCFLDYDQGARDYNIKECATPRTEASVLIWGDSFAAHLYPGLKSHLSPAIDVVQYTATSCRPIRRGNNSRCDAISDRAGEVFNHAHPSVIIISGHWAPLAEKMPDTFDNRLIKSIKDAVDTGARVILTGQSPIYSYKVPLAGFQSSATRTSEIYSLTAKSVDALNANLMRIADENGAEFFDFYDLCSGKVCPAYIKGDPFHWDSGHMTAEGSLYFTQGIAALIRDTRAGPFPAVRR